MTLSESDIRAKLIGLVMHARGWTEDLIRREETAGMVVAFLGGAPAGGWITSFASRSLGGTAGRSRPHRREGRAPAPHPRAGAG
jgi:hypothetical protein